MCEFPSDIRTTRNFSHQNPLYFTGTNNNQTSGRQPSLGNIISASKRESEVEGGSRFIGAKNFFSSLSGMTEAGSNNDADYYEQDYNDEPNQVTKYDKLCIKYFG